LKFSINISDEALSDIKSVKKWYKQKDKEVERKATLEISSTIKRIQENPFLYQEQEDGYRRALTG